MPLTDLAIRQAKPGDKPRKLSDSRGLYIEIRPTGSKLWRYRYRIDGKENVFALGEYPDLSLADARIRHEEARALVKLGKHPAQVRSLAKAEQIVTDQQTFKSVALEWLATKMHASESYQSQVLRSFTKNLFPYIGKFPIKGVSSAMLLECMRRMEARGAVYYAISLRNWVSQMYRYAIRTLRADSDPAAALIGAIGREPIKHSTPMTVEQIKDFRQRLAEYRGFRTNAIGLELLQLLFLRTVELRRGRWAHVDLDSALWEIPAEMMKKKRRHLVPLPPRALALLRELHTITGGRELMFPGLKHADRPVDGSTFNRALMYMGMQGWTCHDFRATASTHLYESGLFRGEVIEIQLAHLERSQTKAAYNHAEYLNERRGMMAWWENFCLYS